MLKAILFPCYNKVNTVCNCIGFEVYLHAITAAALDADLPLNSTAERYLPAKKEHQYALNSKIGSRTRMYWLQKENFFCPIRRTEPRSSRP